MTSGLAEVVRGLAALTGCGIAAGLVSVWTRRTRAFAPGAYALANSSARDPLARPIRHGYGSVQISVRLDDTGRLQVGVARHDDGDPGHTIGPLVLAKLADRVARVGGTVHADQRGPFILMIDIAETEPHRQTRAYEVLDAELRGYESLLTRCADGIAVIGPVMVVLTGAGVPRHLLAAQPDRYAFCDGSLGDVGAWAAPASLVPVVSEHWAWRFGWDGRDEMPAQERHLLCGFVEAAQAEGRRLRFFGLPERPARVREAYWRELSAAGVDLCSATDLGPLARFIRRRSRKATDVRRLAGDALTGPARRTARYRRVTSALVRRTGARIAGR